MIVKPGNILLATPFTEDSFFKRSAVLLAELNDEGAVGFILNKPTDLKLADLLPEIYFDAEISYGGPVGNESVFYIHTLGEAIPNSVEIIPGLFWGGEFEDIKRMLNTGLADISSVKFFAGYSGWGKGQLDSEFKENSWIIETTDYKEIMSGAANDEFWRKELKKHPDYALWANMIDNPFLN